MATTTERLAEAEAALHQLMIGERAVELWFGNRKIVYTAADVGTLQRYVGELKDQVLAELGGRPRPRSRGVVFG